MKLSTFSNRTASTVLDIDGDTLRLTVRPYLMTPERERMMVQGSSLEQFDLLLAFFCEYVVDWDLENDEGTQVALEPDSVQRYLPSTVLLWILKEAKDRTNPLEPTSTSRAKT